MLLTPTPSAPFQVDGVYDCDPAKNPDAVRYNRLTYQQVAAEQLGVMDETAVTLCKENDIPGGWVVLVGARGGQGIEGRQVAGRAHAYCIFLYG